MLATIKRAIGLLAITLAATSTPAYGASSPLGVWMEPAGRAAVEITDCDGKLCGRLVWFQDTKNNFACNLQIIGDVRPVAGGKWDGGWLIDPDKDPNKKYDVEITPLSDQKLKVMGYAGMKFLSETLVFTRARDDLEKCAESVARAPAAPVPNQEKHSAGLSDAAEWVFAFLAVGLLGCHLVLNTNRRKSISVLVFGLALLVLPLMLILLGSSRPLVRLSSLVTCVFVYGVSLFVVLSEAFMRFGGAAALTRWRGEKWVKELDYVYLAVGSLGALLAINRLGAVGEKLILSDVYGPVILVSAFIIRVIKTRAEISEWHRH